MTSWVLIAVATALAATTRSEWLIPGAIALVVGALRLRFGDERMRTAMAAILSRLGSLFGGSLVKLVLALLVVGVGLRVVQSRAPQPIEWVVGAVNPVAGDALTSVPFLAIYFGTGIVALAIFGFVHSIRSWLETLALPLAFVLLFRIYYFASHLVFFEMVRYTTMLAPMLLLLVPLGWRELAAWAKKKDWPPLWRRAAITAIVFAFVAQPVSGSHVLFGQEMLGQRPDGPIDANLQREMRYLIGHVEARPECHFVTAVTRRDAGRDRGARLDYVVFGAELGRMRVSRGNDAGVSDLEAALREHAPDAKCALFYRGLDCNLERVGGCDPLVRDREVVDEWAFANTPYSDPVEYGRHRPRILLGVYQLR